MNATHEPDDLGDADRHSRRYDPEVERGEGWILFAGIMLAIRRRSECDLGDRGDRRFGLFQR